MPARNKQLKLSNLNGYLGQINDNSSPDTVIKLLCRAANCLSQLEGMKNLQRAIRLYTDAYDIQTDVRGSSHTRTFTIVNSIIHCENKMVIVKKNAFEYKQKRLEMDKLNKEAKKKEKEAKKKAMKE